MAAWLNLPLEARLGLLAVVGACLGSLANWLIYSMAFSPRPISPWAAPSDEASPRKWSDRMPVLGWLGLRREAEIHGRGFWIRPLLLELLAAAGAAAFYWWITERGALYPPGFAFEPAFTHAQFAALLLMLTLLTAATFIDFDEQTVPDAVTLPGTLAAHAFAALAPWMLLPAVWPGPMVEPLWAVRQAKWPATWDEIAGIWIGLASFAAWCYAIAPKTCTLRHGWRQGRRYLLASLFRHNRWDRVPLLWMIGSGLILIAWAVGGEHWRALLTSLIGVVIGGGFIWCLRVIAGLSLRLEAMGFGDVTLLAMIGAFLGWQAALLVFFLAPFAAVGVSLLQLLTRGHTHIAFGPYLSVSALVVVVGWHPLWMRARIYFVYPKLLFVVLAVGLALLAATLCVWRPIRERLTR